jgi:hypothetical protein
LIYGEEERKVARRGNFIKAIPRPPKPEEKTSFSKRSKDEEELQARDIIY